MIQSIFADTVNILRRTDYLVASRDALNNPVYGAPQNWNAVYSNIKIRLAWSGKSMSVSSTGELIYPTGTMFYSKDLTIKPEDRIVTVKTPGIPVGIEYVVEAVYPSYILHGIVDHYEAHIRLPVA